ncbi:helix-turn-helix domain-containing protein [Olsenella uli]|uniref:helix-turn-helix domain-containing protein n=1 Tax=Olsenella uli TaxID=133926 RepID=UPI00044F2F20|nr:helix-turn-helix transcriptional regulator [Olsenella uli]EUB31588.1 DNA-binding helix-turn-helix protein [Olsenella uli MSTE5]
MLTGREILRERGITDEQMQVARERTQAYVDAYNLREARKASHMTQVQVADAMGVSQNRVSQIENGDVDAMTVNSIRRYVEALGGRLTLTVEMPDGRKALA